jgi:hypothetical protein
MTSVLVSSLSVNYMKMIIRNGANSTAKSILEIIEKIKKKEGGFGGCWLLGQRFFSDCNTCSGIKKQNQGF